MKRLVFIDLEVNPDSNHISDYGAYASDGAELHTHASAAFYDFIKDAGFLCGHNIIAHDAKKASGLFRDEISAFQKLDSLLHGIFCALLFSKALRANCIKPILKLSCTNHGLKFFHRQKPAL